MQQFYNQLIGQSKKPSYWQSLSVLRFLTLNAITGSSTFLTWETW
jgi:hypothetical protein